jgi:hypothetical protein
LVLRGLFVFAGLTLLVPLSFNFGYLANLVGGAIVVVAFLASQLGPNMLNPRGTQWKPRLLPVKKIADGKTINKDRIVQ